MLLAGNMVEYADLEDLRVFARAKMQIPPDFVIGDNYLRRWWIVPRNRGCNVYLHEILHSDDDRALHDHPWDNTSYLIDGSYTEVTPEGEFLREAGAVVTRKGTDAHQLVIPEGGRAVSLFLTGPIIREWGFHCPQGWRHWKQFVDARDSGQIGIGCGEHAKVDGSPQGGDAEERLHAKHDSAVCEANSPQYQQFIPPPNTKEGDETPFHDEQLAEGGQRNNG